VNTEGIWLVSYTGPNGSGAALIVLSKGTICGADFTGSLVDGVYKNSETGMLDIRAKWTAGSTGVAPVQTGRPVVQGRWFDITATLPPDLGGGAPFQLSTAVGPVEAAFRKIRDLP
jgi:hypothetical protein